VSENTLQENQRVANRRAASVAAKHRFDDLLFRRADLQRCLGMGAKLRHCMPHRNARGDQDRLARGQTPLRPEASTAAASTGRLAPADGGVDLVAGDPDVGQEVIAEALQMPGLTPRPIGSDQRPDNGRNGLR
jgi:hypothetical protein